MIIRYEFAPFNIGLNLSNSNLRKRTAEIFAELGWVNICDIFDIFDILEYKNIADSTLGIYQKNNIWVFAPNNGFFVARYSFQVSVNKPLYQGLAQSLLQRIELHKSIGLTGTHEACSEINNLVHKLRSELTRYTDILYRINNNGRLHEYAFSMYAATNSSNLDDFKYILLNPRDFGFSSSLPDFQIPTLDQAIEKIRMSLCQDFGLKNQFLSVVVRDQGLLVHSSWSSVIAQELKDCQGINLISLCEFRIQSMWSTGLYSQKLANNIDLEKLSLAQYAALNTFHQDLKRLIVHHQLRLGPNAPPDPSKIIANLSNSSDLLKELENADSALTHTVSKATHILNQRHATSRKMIEIFSLVFASSSLAPMLLPTPLNSVIIIENLVMFVIWLTLTLLGIYFVINQK